jgi:hypothetical protein
MVALFAEIEVTASRSLKYNEEEKFVSAYLLSLLNMYTVS